MNKTVYTLLSFIIRKIIVKSSIIGNQKVFEDGYSICVANHLGSFGPMALFTTFSQKLYPWVTHEILDHKKCAHYLKKDFVEPELKLKSPFSTVVAVIFSKICVSLMQYLQAIPVYKQSKKIVETMDISMSYLKQGKTILIFPETDESKENGELCVLDPGFIKLAKKFFSETGMAVRFLPLSVNRETRCIGIGEPIPFNPYAAYSHEKERIIDELEEQISAMYSSCSEGLIRLQDDRAVS